MNAQHKLDTLIAEGNFRSIPPHTLDNGIIDFSTNDYLGLADCSNLRKEFLRLASDRAGHMSASASRLLAANQQPFNELEHYLSSVYEREALIFNSGYHANTGLVSALTDNRSLIIADKLVHASIIDGIKLSGANFRRFRHNDINHLKRIIEAETGKWENILIIVESIYSMDGDKAPLKEIIDIKQTIPNAILYVDEAHAVGVCGPSGLGLVRKLDYNDREQVDIIVGTLGKAFCSAGAYAIMDKTIKNLAVNKARSFIFSTALPPICCEWTLFIMRHAATMDNQRKHLSELAIQLNQGLKELGIVCGEPSHIAPIMIGDPHRALEAAAKLEKSGLKVLPIRTPTVPPGTERLRVSLSASHSAADIDKLLNALKGI